jgi:hypothetical protein
MLCALGHDIIRYNELHEPEYFSRSKLVKSDPGSSVSIVSGYGLDDRAKEIRFPAEAKGFFL